MTRGDLVAVAIPGDYGKPRPALVIQADHFSYLDSVTVLPLTSEALGVVETRISIAPTPENGLRTTSHVMIDKIGTLRREKVGRIIGRVDDEDLVNVERALAAFLGFA